MPVLPIKSLSQKHYQVVKKIVSSCTIFLSHALNLCCSPCFRVCCSRGGGFQILCNNRSFASRFQFWFFLPVWAMCNISVVNYFCI